VFWMNETFTPPKIKIKAPYGGELCG